MAAMNVLSGKRAPCSAGVTQVGDDIAVDQGSGASEKLVATDLLPEQ